MFVNINGINHAVSDGHPDDLDDFAIGFLFGEGSSGANHDVHDIQSTRPSTASCSMSPSPTAVWQCLGSASAAWPVPAAVASAAWRPSNMRCPCSPC